MSHHLHTQHASWCTGIRQGTFLHTSPVQWRKIYANMQHCSQNQDAESRTTQSCLAALYKLSGPATCTIALSSHYTALQDNERLLKLYESGLPVWAIFLPTYGLYYRPWMRRMTWTIFIAVSVFSMACGFYDLYKNVPHLDKVGFCPIAEQSNVLACVFS